MRGDLLQNIRSFETRHNAVKGADISSLQPSERARVVADSLEGLEGLISSVSKQRVIVLMQLLGLDTKVQFSQHQLVVAD